MINKISEIAMNSDPSNNQTLFTVQEVSQRLRCSRALVYLLCEKGKLSHHRLGLGRGTIRISESDLESFLQAAHVEPQRCVCVRKVGGKFAGLLVAELL